MSTPWLYLIGSRTISQNDWFLFYPSQSRSLERLEIKKVRQEEENIYQVNIKWVTSSLTQHRSCRQYAERRIQDVNEHVILCHYQMIHMNTVCFNELCLLDCLLSCLKRQGLNLDDCCTTYDQIERSQAQGPYQDVGNIMEEKEEIQLEKPWMKADRERAESSLRVED